MLLVGSSAAVDAELDLEAALEARGFTDVSANSTVEDRGASAIDVLTVRGTPPSGQDDPVEMAKRVVWDTFALRFDELRVHVRGREPVDLDYDELRIQFGERPSRLDKRSVGDATTVLGVGGIATLLLVAITIPTFITWRRHRGRRKPAEIPIFVPLAVPATNSSPYASAKASTWATASITNNPPPAGPPPRWGLGDVVLGFVYTVAFVLAIGLTVGFGDANSLHESVAAIVATDAGLVLAVVLACRRKGSGRLRDDFGFHAEPREDIKRGIGHGLLARVLQFATLFLLAPFVHFSGGNTENLTEQRTSPAAFVVLAIGIAVIAPLVEELFFRGLLLRSLERRFRPQVALAVSSVFFGLLHGPTNIGLAASITVAGFVFGRLAQRYGRLGPSIVAHATFNMVAVIVIALT